jgi:uncharacterized protein YbaR (Trm112 family)
MQNANSFSASLVVAAGARPLATICYFRLSCVLSGHSINSSGEITMSEPSELPISRELFEILRCPLAVQSKEYGDDPGRLRLVHNCWLVCDDSGLKYPIRDGIPVMLIDEGMKWKDTPEEQLPVPPPAA